MRAALNKRTPPKRVGMSGAEGEGDERAEGKPRASNKLEIATAKHGHDDTKKTKGDMGCVLLPVVSGGR